MAVVNTIILKVRFISKFSETTISYYRIQALHKIIKEKRFEEEDCILVYGTPMIILDRRQKIINLKDRESRLIN